MEAIVKIVNGRNSMDFTYRLIGGGTMIKDYGLFIARAIWSPEVMEQVAEDYRKIEEQKVSGYSCCLKEFRVSLKSRSVYI